MAKKMSKHEHHAKVTSHLQELMTHLNHPYARHLRSIPGFSDALADAKDTLNTPFDSGDQDTGDGDQLPPDVQSALAPQDSAQTSPMMEDLADQASSGPTSADIGGGTSPSASLPPPIIPPSQGTPLTPISNQVRAYPKTLHSPRLGPVKPNPDTEKAYHGYLRGEPTAYDYTNQKWVSGPKALELKRKQQKELNEAMKDSKFRAMIKKES